MLSPLSVIAFRQHEIAQHKEKQSQPKRSHCKGIDRNTVIYEYRAERTYREPYQPFFRLITENMQSENYRSTEYLSLAAQKNSHSVNKNDCGNSYGQPAPTLPYNKCQQSEEQREEDVPVQQSVHCKYRPEIDKTKRYLRYDGK